MAILEAITKAAADIICMTEAHASFLGNAGHSILAQADHGYPIRSDRRKVMLWSKEPWADVDSIGHKDLPTGRFVAGTTRSPIGDVRIIGVCIPWPHAHVSTGRRNRRPWEDHLSYITGLETILANAPEPAILMGDFNQTLPRSRAPVAAEVALRGSLARRFIAATTGLRDDAGNRCIDHICHTPSLRVDALTVIPSVSDQGQRLSDHFGIRAEIRPACR